MLRQKTRQFCYIYFLLFASRHIFQSDTIFVHFIAADNRYIRYIQTVRMVELFFYFRAGFRINIGIDTRTAQLR